MAFGNQLPLFQKLKMFLDGRNTQPCLSADGLQAGPAVAFVTCAAEQVRIHQKGWCFEIQIEDSVVHPEVMVYLLFGEQPSVWWLQIFYYMLCNIVLILGFTLFTSAVNVLFKDMGQIVNIMLQFGFWLAPVMWDLSMLPEQFHFWIKLNPFYYIVQGFRDSFVFHKGFWEYPGMTAYFWVVTGIVFILGCYVFKKLKPHFADVL